MKPDLKNTTASPDVESNKNFFFVKYLTHPSNEILFNFALFKLIIEKLIIKRISVINYRKNLSSFKMSYVKFLAIL